MKCKEVFKSIPDYPDYEVSDLGRVRSMKFGKEKYLKGYTISNGRLAVFLHKDGKGKCFQIHQLVAIAFLGHEPCGMKVIVDHKDNDHLNNRVDNLQLTSQRVNVSKDRKGGTSKHIGVHWAKRERKWLAQIRINGKPTYLGTYHNEIDAAEAYQEALNSLVTA